MAKTFIKANQIDIDDLNSSADMQASESAAGVVELATQAEVNTGTDTTKVVTPATLQEKALDTAMLMAIIYGA